jgi:hypothetical protein
MVAASGDSESDGHAGFGLYSFYPSVDAFSRDDEDDGDEGMLCWWSCRPCLCVFLAFDSVVLMAFSALPLSRFFLSFFSSFSLFSPFFFCLASLLFFLFFFSPPLILPALLISQQCKDEGKKLPLFSAFLFYCLPLLRFSCLSFVVPHFRSAAEAFR